MNQTRMEDRSVTDVPATRARVECHMASVPSHDVMRWISVSSWVHSTHLFDVWRWILWSRMCLWRVKGLCRICISVELSCAALPP
jgi:hypothetical protein